MKIFMYITYLFIYLSILISWKKISNSRSSINDNGKAQSFVSNNLFSAKTDSTYSWTNENLLGLVLSGKGGFILVDSSCESCSYDTLSRVEFPSYIPPVNNGEMLVFASKTDYDLFIESANLMEDLWKYSDDDYEDTPFEIYHLGEESFNAFDSAMGFKSLRSIYELSDFYDYNWKDTAAVYVEDDDMQIALNELNEVKIGSKYYKYVTNNILAEINDNYSTLDSVRAFGIFTKSDNLRFYDEQADSVARPTWIEIIEEPMSCPDFRLPVFGYFSSYINPSSSRWAINTSVYNTITGSYPRRYNNVKGNYTVDWGDGTVENFTGNFVVPNIFYHIYQYPATGFLVRTITVTCQLVQQQNPSQEYTDLLNNCPSLPTIIFTSTTTIRLETYNYPDCLKERIVRQFNGIEQYVNGTKYRVECKLKQVTYNTGLIINIISAKVEAVIVFTKLKNNRWKKTKSIGDLTLNLRGDVYRAFDCTDLFYTINETKTKHKRKKIKLKILGKVGTAIYFPNNFRTKQNLPLAVNADFIWKYNNGSTIVGNFNERIRP